VRARVWLRTLVGEPLDVTYRIKGVQLEQSPARTAYQQNFTNQNVTEAGVPDRYYLFDDLVDDAINWPAPSGTYTVNIAARAGITTETGQALSGQVDALRARETFGYVAVDRALSASEQAALTRYLEGISP
jgi:hypothetical protein